MLDQLVLDHLLEVGTLGAQLRQPIHHVLYQVEPIQLVLHPNVKGSGDRALFHVAPDVDIPVRPTVGKPVDQPWVPMEAEDDGLVPGEERVVVPIAQSVRVLALRLQAHEIHDVDHADLQLG